MFNTYGATSNNCLPCGSPLHPAGTHATVPSNGYRTRGCEWACNAGYEAYNDARGEGCAPMIVTGPGPGSPTTAPAVGRTTAPSARVTTPRPSTGFTVAPSSTPSRVSSAVRLGSPTDYILMAYRQDYILTACLLCMWVACFLWMLLAWV
jgi:hypothetical protein